MENINNRCKELRFEVKAEQNMLKTEYEYLLNRERKISLKKELLLVKLLHLKRVLKQVG